MFDAKLLLIASEGDLAKMVSGNLISLGFILSIPEKKDQKEF